MISFQTSRFGVIEVAEEKIINFPEGIPGFPLLKRYILMDYKDTPLKWLQAVDEPDVAFIVVEPRLINPDFNFVPDEQTKSLLELQKDDDLVILIIIRREGEQVVANLQYPLLFNSLSMKGMQICVEEPI